MSKPKPRKRLTAKQIQDDIAKQKEAAAKAAAPPAKGKGKGKK